MWQYQVQVPLYAEKVVIEFPSSIIKQHIRSECRVSSTVECKPSKLDMRVRFPYSAPLFL